MSKRLFQFLVLVLSIILIGELSAQSVGINTNSPHPSAALEVYGGDKGLLIPRMSSTERSTIIAPANGLLVYDITTRSFWYYKATEWVEIAKGVFENTGGVVHNTGDHGTDDFVFGSEVLPPVTSLSDTLMFFDKSKGAFRAGVLFNSNAWAPDSIGLNSIALGQNTKAIASHSTALGFQTKASGYASTVLGYNTRASDNYATAMGFGTKANGNSATAMGNNTVATGGIATAIGYYTAASGYASTAMGYYTTANGYASTSMGINTNSDAHSVFAIGRFNVGGGSNGSWISTDPLFEIGNGTSDGSRKNAVTVLKNGDFIIGRDNVPPATAISDLLVFFDKSKGAFRAGALLSSNAWAPDSTGLYSVAFGVNTKATGSYSTALGYGTIAHGPYSTSFGNGSIARGHSSTALGDDTVAEGSRSTAMGNETLAAGNYSTAMGSSSAATGDYSTAMGSHTSANGNYSTAKGIYSVATGFSSTAMGNSTTAIGFATTTMGYNTEAIGEYSIAMGRNSEASGNISTAMGNSTSAKGICSIAMGSFARARASYSLAIGRWNAGEGDSLNWVSTDPIFEIGIGAHNSNRLNAMTVLKNGYTGLGTATPDSPLQIFADANSTVPQLKLTESIADDGARIIFDNSIETANRWTLYGRADNTDASSAFNIFYNNAGNIITATGLGNVGIKGTPDADFHIRHSNSGGSGGLKLQNSFNDEFARLYISSGDGNLRIYFDTSGLKGTFNDVNGVYSTVSDRRLKTNFEDLAFDWTSFSQLAPLSYTYSHDQESKRYIGMIAQDVKEVYPELVTYSEDEDRYTMDYSGFGVIAIKAIQEQQKEIEALTERLQSLEKLLSELTEQKSKGK